MAICATPENSSKQRQGIFYGWVVLLVAFVTIVLGYAIRNTFSVFYPTIVEEFGWGRGSTALMFSITMLVYGFTAPVAGSLVDRFDPKIILPLGACIAGGGLALCSLAAAQWHFYLLYGVVVAVGLSMVGWTPLTAIISKWFVNKRGMAFGILAAGFGGSLVFASVAQFLISTFGWQAAYIIIGVCSAAVIVPLCGLFVHRSPQEKGLFPDDLRQISPEPPDSDESLTLNGAGEGWISTTWTLSRALKTYRFWLLFSMSFCLLGLAEQIVIAHQVYFFRDVGYEPMAAANIHSVFGILFVLGNFCSGVSDRFGRERVFIPSIVLSAGAVCLLFLIRDASQPWMALLYAVCFGFGFGFAGPVLFTTVADLFHGRYFGSIQGAIVTGFSLGGTIAPWLAGFLHDTTGSYLVTFLIILGSLVASAVMMWLVAPRKVRPVRT